MGADIRIRARLSRKEFSILENAARAVPIDVGYSEGTLHFHYAYWGDDHANKCEAFVDGFCMGRGIKRPKWGY